MIVAQIQEMEMEFKKAKATKTVLPTTENRRRKKTIHFNL